MNYTPEDLKELAEELQRVLKRLPKESPFLDEATDIESAIMKLRNVAEQM